MLFEIIWPLCLFLILVLLRTKGFRTQQPHCHFTERPLPSSGLIPFLRAYICELNNSCSQIPRNSYYTYDENFNQFTQIIYNFLNVSIESNIFTLINKSSNILEDVRNRTFNITGIFYSHMLFLIIKIIYI